jgi:hypothetical protein
MGRRVIVPIGFDLNDAGDETYPSDPTHQKTTEEVSGHRQRGAEIERSGERVKGSHASVPP